MLESKTPPAEGLVEAFLKVVGMHTYNARMHTNKINYTFLIYNLMQHFIV